MKTSRPCALELDTKNSFFSTCQMTCSFSSFNHTIQWFFFFVPKYDPQINSNSCSSTSGADNFHVIPCAAYDHTWLLQQATMVHFHQNSAFKKLKMSCGFILASVYPMQPDHVFLFFKIAHLLLASSHTRALIYLFPLITLKSVPKSFWASWRREDISHLDARYHVTSYKVFFSRCSSKSVRKMDV